MPPVNDDIGSAIPVTLPAVVNGSTVGATISTSPEFPFGWDGEKEVWYRVDLAEPSWLRITSSGDAGFRPYVDVIAPANGVSADSLDDIFTGFWQGGWYESGEGGAPATQRCLLPAGVFYLAVMDWNFEGNEGDFTLDLELVPIVGTDLEFSFDFDYSDAPEEDQTTFLADPLTVLYMQVANGEDHGDPVSFEVRQAGTTPPGDEYDDRYFLPNPVAICTPTNAQDLNFDDNYWNNTKATSQDGEPDHAGFPARKSVWFQWPGLTPGVPYDIWVESDDDDFVLSVYEVAATLEELGPPIAEDDDSGGDGQPLVTVVSSGIDLAIAVDSKGLGGAFTLNARLSSATRPSNDDFANAEILPGTGGAITGNLVGASYECGTPLAGSSEFPYTGGFEGLQRSGYAIGGDIWYQFIAAGNDYTLTWDSPVGVRVSVYTAFNPAVPQLSQLQPYTSFAGASQSIYDDSRSVTFGVTPGTTYYVRVEQVDDVQDDVDFTWATPAPEVGDDFDDAPDITPTVPAEGGILSYDWDLTGAGQQPNEPVDDPAVAIRSVWRKFTPAHDCTYWTQYGSGTFGFMPTNAYVDVWRGDTLGSLDLCALELTTGNLGVGTTGWYGVRLKKGEEYRIRISNLKSSAPIAGSMTVNIEYEMDDPWTDADGWDSETGTPADWTDGVLTFSETGYRTVNPWLNGKSSRHAYISFDVRLEAEWSPTAADGPVLGRQPGPTTHYPYSGNRITLLRLHVTTQIANSSVYAMDIVGNINGECYLEMWNETGGGNSVNNRIWTDFALPNAQTEGGGWIPIEITPIGVYVQGRLALEGSFGLIQDIDWGPYRFPTRQGWDPGDPPPETFTLQFQNMRASDRLRNGGVVHQGAMISEFDTRVHHTPTYQPVFGGPNPLYPRNPALASSDGAENPVEFEAPNPSSNPNHQWDAVRVHDQCLYWDILQRDTSYLHNGWWITFDAFPNTGESVVVGVLRRWSGTQFGYYNDICRLEVNSIGEVYIDPYRHFQRPGLPGYPNFIGDPNGFKPKIPEPRRQKIGQMALNEAYWIETWVDLTFPWDAVMHVAVNEVECFPEYHALINQVDDSRVSAGRYSGLWNPLVPRLAIGAPTGTPIAFGNDEGDYNGHCDLYLGPWFVGRGGTPTTGPAKPTGKFPIGAHAGGIYPAAGRTGVHRIPDAATLDMFETTPAAMAAACDGFFEYNGIRLYKGNTSNDESVNPDMSLGTFGYAEKNIGSEPSLPPTVVADGTGPVGPFGDDYTAEAALEIAHDPSGPGSLDHAKYGDSWDYLYHTPDVREGGEPDDDGGDHFLIFAWARRVGGTSLFIDMCYDVRGDLGLGPSYTLNDEDWHWLYGTSYSNHDYTESDEAYGVWRFAFSGGSMVHFKRIHMFKNARTYPRFKVTVDNGASSNWLISPTDVAHTYLADDLNDDSWDAGIFMDNVCPFERFNRTGPKLAAILGEPSTGISMGDYRPRRYVEVKPPPEADLEDMNLVPSALKVAVRGAGFGINGVVGDVSTARTNGTLRVRMTHGDVRHVVHNFPMISTDRTTLSQCLPMTPSGFSWQADRVSELTTRMGYHFNFDDMSLDDSWGYRLWQSGSAICKGLAYEVFAETTPGPPICQIGGGRWKSRLTRRI